MSETGQTKLARAADATVVAELFHAGTDDRLDAAVVTPLVEDGRIALALPYSQRAFAETLRDARHLTLVLSDDRMALRNWKPLAVTGRITLEPDPEDLRFSAAFLDEELRKYPPSRVLADSLRDRHDNWWFLRRLLCYLEVDEVRPVAVRTDPTTGVLAWLTAAGLQVETVEIVDADEQQTFLRALSGEAIRGAGDPAVVFRHDYSQPDLERRSERCEFGRLEGDTLRGVERRGELALPEVPTLRQRFRRQREFSKACRLELARARRGG